MRPTSSKHPTPNLAETRAQRPERPKLEWLDRNPIVGLAGFLIGVFSLAVSVYFGVVTLRSRELSYWVNPTKTSVVKSGQSSDLHVLYKGQNVSTDVTALQVAVWNNGRESIRAENILTPITLITSPRVPILEAQVKQVNRIVSQIGVDTGRIANGSVNLTWRILEHNDGALLQLIVAGPSSVTVQAEGVIEGQEKIKAYEKRSEKDLGVLDRVKSLFFLLTFIAGLLSCISMIPRAERRFGRLRGGLFGGLVTVGFFFLFVYCLDYIARSPVPPVFR